jgi:uncharacterized phiE125 gp8 family phage protein
MRFFGVNGLFMTKGSFDVCSRFCGVLFRRALVEWCFLKEILDFFHSYLSLFASTFAFSLRKNPSTSASVVPGCAYATPRIRYWDMDGVQITMVKDDTYELLLDDNPPRIVLPPTELWPITMAYQRGAVEVDFVAGYGEAAGSVPPMLRQAVKILAAHWYEHREAVGNFGGEVPLSIENIIRLYSDGGYN